MSTLKSLRKFVFNPCGQRAQSCRKSLICCLPDLQENRFAHIAVRTLLVGVLAISLSYLAWFGFTWVSNAPRTTYLLADAPCKHPFSGDVSAPSIITTSESAIVRLGLNQFGDPRFRAPNWSAKDSAVCVARIQISAPSFQYEPVGAVRSFLLQPVDESKYATWVIAPKAPGTYKILLAGGLDSTIITVTVLTDLGLTAKQSAIASAFVALVAAVLGLLTLREAVSKMLAKPTAATSKRNKRKWGRP
jgi:hypothetical protein